MRLFKTDVGIDGKQLMMALLDNENKSYSICYSYFNYIRLQLADVTVMRNRDCKCFSHYLITLEHHFFYSLTCLYTFSTINPDSIFNTTSIHICIIHTCVYDSIKSVLTYLLHLMLHH